jgi:hypothetical protein
MIRLLCSTFLKNKMSFNRKGGACKPCRPPSEAELAKARMYLGPELKTLADEVAAADARLERQRKRLEAKEKDTVAQFEKLMLQSAADVTNLHKQYKIDMQGLMDKVKSHQADCQAAKEKLQVAHRKELAKAKADERHALELLETLSSKHDEAIKYYSGRIEEFTAHKTESAEAIGKFKAEQGEQAAVAEELAKEVASLSRPASDQLKEANGALTADCMLCLASIDARTTASYGLCCAHTPVDIKGIVEMDDPSCSCGGARCRSKLYMEVVDRKMITMSKIRICTNCILGYQVNTRGRATCMACNLPGTASIVRFGALL